MICINSGPQIRKRAYDIFQERLQTGRKGDAISDWLEAEYEIRQHRIPAQASMVYLHPNRLRSMDPPPRRQFLSTGLFDNTAESAHGS